jgi:hypothetical protein
MDAQRAEIAALAQANAQRTQADAVRREQMQQAAIQAWYQKQAAQQQALQASLDPSKRQDIAMLQQAAMGQGPSAAALQAKQSGEQIAAQQYGMAASQGSNPAAIRAALMSGGQAQQAAAGQATMARANEQMQAQQLYAQAYGQGVGQQLQGMGQMGQTGLGALGIGQQASAVGQQGQIAGGGQLMDALQLRYGMQRDPEADQVKLAMQKMASDAQMQQMQAQIDASPSFWERMGSALFTTGGVIIGGMLGGPAGAAAGGAAGNTLAGGIADSNSYSMQEQAVAPGNVRRAI